MVQASDEDALKCDQNDQTVAENIVVEGAEELSCEERREPALFKERKLVGI